MVGRVEAVFASPIHSMTKAERPAIRLLAGLGVDGDAHLSETVQHRSRVRSDPHGGLVRRVGVMAVVLTGGWVGPGDAVLVARPAPPYRPLEPV